jgi:hypothetical protein
VAGSIGFAGHDSTEVANPICNRWLADLALEPIWELLHHTIAEEVSHL